MVAEGAEGAEGTEGEVVPAVVEVAAVGVAVEVASDEEVVVMVELVESDVLDSNDVKVCCHAKYRHHSSRRWI